jgi:hypothetical protein
MIDICDEGHFYANWLHFSGISRPCALARYLYIRSFSRLFQGGPNETQIYRHLLRQLASSAAAV